MMRSLARRACAAMGLYVLTSLAGCGARTDLRVPADAAAPGDAFVRYDRCVDGRFALARREARAVFVIDRSGSMSEPFGEAEQGSRWDVMLSALEETLPSFEAHIEMGALAFPRSQGTSSCAMPSDVSLDVAPAARNAATVVGHLADNVPEGATPTAAAVGVAAQYLLSHEARGVASYLVLATDGAPNCNADLDATTCQCVHAGSCVGASAGEGCLDDDGTVAAITGARSRGVATYVIGIDGDLEARFVDVLDRMAVAGGRALAGPRRYYSIRERGQLAAAFEDIARTVSRCAFVTPSRPDAPDRITVRAGGAPVPRDPTRRDGWDWTDRDYGEVTLFGPACDRALAASQPVEAAVTCGR